MAKKVEWKLPEVDKGNVLKEEPLKETPVDTDKTSKSNPKKVEWKLPKGDVMATPQEAAQLGGTATGFGEEYLQGFDFTTKVGGNNELLRAQRQL